MKKLYLSSLGVVVLGGIAYIAGVAATSSMVSNKIDKYVSDLKNYSKEVEEINFEIVQKSSSLFSSDYVLTLEDKVEESKYELPLKISYGFLSGTLNFDFDDIPKETKEKLELKDDDKFNLSYTYKVFPFHEKLTAQGDFLMAYDKTRTKVKIITTNNVYDEVNFFMSYDDGANMLFKTNITGPSSQYNNLDDVKKFFNKGFKVFNSFDLKGNSFIDKFWISYDSSKQKRNKLYDVDIKSYIVIPDVYYDETNLYTKTKLVEGPINAYIKDINYAPVIDYADKLMQNSQAEFLMHQLMVLGALSEAVINTATIYVTSDGLKVARTDAIDLDTKKDPYHKKADKVEIPYDNVSFDGKFALKNAVNFISDLDMTIDWKTKFSIEEELNYMGLEDYGINVKYDKLSDGYRIYLKSQK